MVSQDCRSPLADTRIYLVSADPAAPGVADTHNPVWADVLTSTGAYREASRDEWLVESQRIDGLAGVKMHEE